MFLRIDEDLEVFKNLKCSAIPTINFVPRSCRREVARCYAKAIKAINEVSGDLNR